MSGNRATALHQRVAQWRADLWQVYEGQFEPVTPAAVIRYLRGIRAWTHWTGLGEIDRELDKLVGEIAGVRPPPQSEVETRVHTLLQTIEADSETVTDPPGLRAYAIHVGADPEFFASSLDITLVWEDLAKLGSLEVLPDITACPPWEQFDPGRCFLRWDLILVTSVDLDRVRDSLDFVASEPGIEFKVDENLPVDRVRQLRSRGAVAPIPDKPIPTPDNPAGYRRRASDLDAPRTTARAAGPRTETSIRMSIERLDKIIDAVGELVTAQGRLMDVAARAPSPDLSSAAEEIERLTLLLRDASMGLRMQPVGSLFARFNRLVHDLCQSLGKEVDFITEGEETEIDRTVVEKLYDPLVHIVRNSLDHGIEAPGVRAAAGKPRQGTLKLHAYQQGPEVIVEVLDDGAGIDPAKVLAKAIEKGLVKPEAVLEDHQIADLIFLPGFSTATKVSDVSGRGVGMDVVKSNVEALRGQVEFRSVRGKGSTMTLRFPLTMAIIDGLCVVLGGEKYILPLDPVEECLDLERYEDGGRVASDLQQGRQGILYNLRGQAIPLFNLATVVGPRPTVGTKIIVLRTSRGEKVALVVDEIVRRQQVVINPLGPLHAFRKELSGATILGDGSIALVLDLGHIVRRMAEASEGGKPIRLS
ncbi:MAG TPA: chemotaxis protein CheA [Spirochaetia bacterium]|nr:chemotaxis protein CheA [Spirochaetia bacterium]